MKLHRMITENQETIKHLRSVPSVVHGGIPERQRQAIFKRFMEGEINYLICTDLASRGIDTLSVEHVIMYDFPRNPIDFLHRMGRTGRLSGQRGTASCLVSARDFDLATAVKQAIKTGTSFTKIASGPNHELFGEDIGHRKDRNNSR